MKTLSFNQLKKLVREASRDTGYDVKDVTMVDIDDPESLESALKTLQESGAAAEGILKVRDALKKITSERIKQRAIAKAHASAARTEDKDTKDIDDAAKAFAELDGRVDTNFFFAVKDGSKRIGAFVRKTKNPLGGPAAIAYVLKAITDPKFKAAHEELCVFAEAMMAQANIIFARMKKQGVYLPDEEKWTAELRMLQDGGDRVLQYKAKLDESFGDSTFGKWLNMAWDRTVGVFKNFTNWVKKTFSRLFTSAEDAAEVVSETFDDILEHMDNDIQNHDMAMLQESRRRALRDRRALRARR